MHATGLNLKSTVTGSMESGRVQIESIHLCSIYRKARVFHRSDLFLTKVFVCRCRIRLSPPGHQDPQTRDCKYVLFSRV